MGKSKRIISLILVFCILLGAPGAAVYVSYAEDTYAEIINSPEVLAKQERRRTCTLASATMMLKRAAVITGDASWQMITESLVGTEGWIEGEGLRHSFTFTGMDVSYSDFREGSNKIQLMELLSLHPEGIVLYERSKPHAILITDYDVETDTFYCADPARAASRIPVEDSTLGDHVKGGGDQERIVEDADCYWYISSELDYTKVEILYDISASFVYTSGDASDVSMASVTDTVKYGDYLTFANYSDMLSKGSYLNRKDIFKGWMIQRKSDGKWAVESDSRWMTDEEIAASGVNKRTYCNGYIMNFDTTWVGQTDSDETYVLYAVWDEGMADLQQNSLNAAR